MWALTSAFWGTSDGQMPVICQRDVGSFSVVFVASCMQTAESDVMLGLSKYSCNLGLLGKEGDYALNVANISHIFEFKNRFSIVWQLHITEIRWSNNKF